MSDPVSSDSYVMKSRPEPNRYEDPEATVGYHSSPITNYVHERSADNPNYWVFVRLKTPEEMAAEEAADKVQKAGAAARKRAAASGDDRRTALYRIRSASDDLLYIGISANPPQRWLQHADDKSWWSEVAGFSIEWFGSRAEALAMEAHAIRSEHPLHNVVHNQQRPAT